MKTDKTENDGFDRLYIAYGSNLNLCQMERRCPTAKIAGTAVLSGWRLIFRDVATIERHAGYIVPVLVWKIYPGDEFALDRYEGWPHLYRKKALEVVIDGRSREAMVYIMNEEAHPYCPPAERYLETIRQGYLTAGFDQDILYRAVSESAAKEPAFPDMGEEAAGKGGENG